MRGEAAGRMGAAGAFWSASPNFGPRRGRLRPSLVVLHYTAMMPSAAAQARLCEPGSGVSSHYLIAPDGGLCQMVCETQRAWHAGAGAWGGGRDVNSRSIGIELANDGQSPFAAPLMARLETLLAEVLARWSIPPSGVIAHSDMAPGRKSDPGPRFDWRRLARSGLAVWPLPGGDGGADFDTRASCFGYPEGEARLAAFRLRFRPWARGPLSAADRAAIDDLARRHPAAPDLGRP